MGGQSEASLQSAAFQWHWNTFPGERGLLHANNNNSYNAIKGNQNKALGVVKGVADMEYCKGGQTIFIEVKSDVGSQSLEQVRFQALVQAEGFRYEVVRSVAQFQALITEIQQLAIFLP